MEQKLVAVVMSTYNGERFIGEQLNSILKQTYRNFKIVIRDDGSTDRTVAIIKKYQEKYKNIELHTGKNLGFVKSFFELLSLTEADYYSYADQDDVWMENKIELAVNSLNEMDPTKPALVFGNSDYYDENMNFIGPGEKNKKYSFTQALFSCVAQGMTMTINKKTRDTIIHEMPKSCFFHDWWTYLVCIGLGNVAYNNVTTVKYRRRKENATSEGQGYISLLKWRVKNLLLGKGMKDIRQQMINYKTSYYFSLDQEKRAILDTFVPEDETFIGVMRKVLYPHRLRRKILDGFMLRIMFLLGVL